MEIRPYTHHFITLALLGLTALALVRGVAVTYEPEAGVRTELPDEVGVWTGENLYYCTNAGCMTEFRESQLKEAGLCPQCEKTLLTESPWEKPYLPADTTILKKSYRSPAGQELLVAVVLSGSDRSSIHRPQLCLVGQGYEIMSSRVLRIPHPDQPKSPTGVMLLDMERRYQTRSGATVTRPSFFAYWFVGRGRETPYHWQRMIWMATDRLFRSHAYRWSYISVTGIRQPDSPDPVELVQSFIADLHPLLVKP
jgi:hypothetical protein